MYCIILLHCTIASIDQISIYFSRYSFNRFYLVEKCVFTPHCLHSHSLTSKNNVKLLIL